MYSRKNGMIPPWQTVKTKSNAINCIHAHTTVEYLLLLHMSGPLKTCRFSPVEGTMLSTSDMTLGNLPSTPAGGSSGLVQTMRFAEKSGPA